MKKTIALAGLAIMLYAALGAAQYGEIASQNVPFGGKAYQYALIDKNTTSPSPCPDCIAYATIKTGSLTYQKGPMIEELPGYFSISLNNNFEVGQTYFMRVDLSSPTYGNGTADSYITIVDRDATPAPPSSSDPVSGLINGALKTVTDAFAAAFKPVSDMLAPVEKLFKAFEPLISFLQWMIKGFISVTEWLKPILAAIGGWMVQNIKDFVQDPTGTTIKIIKNVLVWAAGLLFFTFGGIFLIVEICGLMVNVRHNDPVAFLSGMVRYNYSILEKLARLAYALLTAAKRAVPFI